MINYRFPSCYKFLLFTTLYRSVKPVIGFSTEIFTSKLFFIWFDWCTAVCRPQLNNMWKYGLSIVFGLPVNTFWLFIVSHYWLNSGFCLPFRGLFWLKRAPVLTNRTNVPIEKSYLIFLLQTEFNSLTYNGFCLVNYLFEWNCDIWIFLLIIRKMSCCIFVLYKVHKVWKGMWALVNISDIGCIKCIECRFLW